MRWFGCTAEQAVAQDRETVGQVNVQLLHYGEEPFVKAVDGIPAEPFPPALVNQILQRSPYLNCLSTPGVGLTTASEWIRFDWAPAAFDSTTM
jgi:hypothetical protein